MDLAHKKARNLTKNLKKWNFAVTCHIFTFKPLIVNK